MSEIINIKKTVFSKDIYPNIINTEFNQLIPPTSENETLEITVDEFFEIYNNLFYEIPIDGEFNSHKYIIKQSTEYVGESQNTEEIDLLLEEINQLRLELLEARQTIDELTQ